MLPLGRHCTLITFPHMLMCTHPILQRWCANSGIEITCRKRSEAAKQAGVSATITETAHDSSIEPQGISSSRLPRARVVA
jgi:hypothetical protein